MVMLFGLRIDVNLKTIQNVINNHQFYKNLKEFVPQSCQIKHLLCFSLANFKDKDCTYIISFFFIEFCCNNFFKYQFISLNRLTMHRNMKQYLGVNTKISILNELKKIKHLWKD